MTGINVDWRRIHGDPDYSRRMAVQSKPLIIERLQRNKIKFATDKLN